MTTVSDLTQRITLQARVPGVDQRGQTAAAFVDVATVWASARPVRGREWFAAGGEQRSADVRFVVRWRDDLPADARVLWQGQVWDVVGLPINVRGERQWAELMATRGTGDARP